MSIFRKNSCLNAAGDVSSLGERVGPISPATAGAPAASQLLCRAGEMHLGAAHTSELYIQVLRLVNPSRCPGAGWLPRLSARRRSSPACSLSLDGHAPPERDVAGDVGGGWAGVGVVPRRVAVDLLADPNRVVARLALPWAGGMGIAGYQMLLPDRLWWEVVIALHHDRPVAFCDDRALPHRPYNLPGAGLGVTVTAMQPLEDSYRCHAPDHIERGARGL